ncbi:hypothetical protein DRE_03223 [Drechslerella stenobrocha 248]|uniref:Uncharacterized protein n=1 Tax=Drechslerella stenobrocha 248 TaxID=1043628 RepID=W7I622_9PEZI|nr:hypothetical protein DRE_03223 [Drechslerella stenobrocha 248]
MGGKHVSIPFASSTGQQPSPFVMTPPSSSGSNQPFASLASPRFVHPARRRGSADSYLSADDDHSHSHSGPSYARSPSSSSGSGGSGAHQSPRSGSPHSQSPSLPSQAPHINTRDIAPRPLGELEFDVEPLSPFSYAPPTAAMASVSTAPPSRKNSRDAYSHVAPPAQVYTLSQRLTPEEEKQQPPQQLPQPQQLQHYRHSPHEPDGTDDDEEHTIQLHAMPRGMLLPLPDRNAEMKHLLDHNAGLRDQIRRRLGDDKFSHALDLWTHTRRSELSDHEWLRRSRWFLKADERLWNEWAMMVGWDHSQDLGRDESGNVRPVEEYVERTGHMECLVEGEEE